MIKRTYKTLIKNNTIKEVRGYYYKIDDIRLFIYFDSIWRTWYVVDTNIGLSFAKGLTMRNAKNDAEKKLNKLLSIRDESRYQKLKWQYQRLLKDDEYE